MEQKVPRGVTEPARAPARLARSVSVASDGTRSEAGAGLRAFSRHDGRGRPDACLLRRRRSRRLSVPARGMRPRLQLDAVRLLLMTTHYHLVVAARHEPNAPSANTC